jgi:hypothetical protein
MSDEFIESVINTKENVEPEEEELEDFKVKVSEWFKLDDQIRKLEIAVKERKTMRNKLNDSIKHFMFKYNYDDLNTQHGMIKANKKEYVVPVKVNDIKSKILEYSNLSGDELIDKIFNVERQKVEKHTIKRLVPRITMAL